MKAEIIAIGDELLIGQVVNTNAARIGEMLNLAGIRVIRSGAIADDAEEIINAMESAARRADLIIITGGLGPTRDDITKKTLAEFFKTCLVMNEDVLKDVTAFFERRGRALNEVNRLQAEVPENCTVIRNKYGTAPGMWFHRDGKIFISMPGVPYETLAMMQEFVIPKLKAEFDLPFIYHKTILTQGIGESYLAEKIEKWEDSLAAKNIKLAYLPAVGMVRLRLSGSGKKREEVIRAVEEKIREVLPQIEKYVYGFEEFGKPTPRMEEIVGNLLRERKKTIALAESCTGGYISHLLTSVAGSSDYFMGCLIPYHNQFKQELLGVEENIFSSVGAVSRECVMQMAAGTLQKFSCDYAIAVSGIAGPSGGSDEKPVGTVWIAWANKKEVRTEKFLFGNERVRNIQLASLSALNGLRRMLLEEKEML